MTATEQHPTAARVGRVIGSAELIAVGWVLGTHGALWALAAHGAWLVGCLAVYGLLALAQRAAE